MSGIILCIQLPAQQANSDKEKNHQSLLFEKLKTVSANSQWTLISATPLHFPTYHTQGLTKADGFFFLTAVKVIRWPKHYNSPVNGYDRDNGEGIGYLFKFNSTGKLTDSIRLGEGVIYHPGGIDFDGKYIWIPVCEYRPNGKSFIYRVDPVSMQKTRMTTCNDALGAVVYNRNNNTLVGMNWGSRRFYEWQVTDSNNHTVLQPVSKQDNSNPHFYIDYQDCNYIGAGLMLCGGLRTYKKPDGSCTFKLGGIEVIDMNSFYAMLQLPVNEWTSSGAIMTNNPCYAEIADGKPRFYFIPEDDQSVLYTYELE